MVLECGGRGGVSQPAHRQGQSIPIAEMGKRLKEIPKRSTVVAYCRGRTACLRRCSVLLRKHGYEALRLRTGFPEWKVRGLPIERTSCTAVKKSIDTRDSQKWLASGKPVTVLDIRTDEDRAQWSIPGVYHRRLQRTQGRKARCACRCRDSQKHSGCDICNMGRVSQGAAQALQRAVFEASSLEGE